VNVTYFSDTGVCVSMFATCKQQKTMLEAMKTLPDNKCIIYYRDRE